MTPSDALADDVRRLAASEGLAAVGFTHADPFVQARLKIESQKAQGLHGGMQFTYRNPERSTTPTRILDDAESLIVGAWAYASPASVGSHAGASAEVRPQADIAAYAWRDHYADLRGALTAIAELLRERGFQARVVADDNALVDRAAAIRAGIGWAGKNSNVLLPGRGSWFVLGAVVTNAVLPPAQAIEDGCGPCTRCSDHCPTQAIVSPGVVDARRCLAWLLQADGDFPVEFRQALGTRLYGCDDCQDVCPPGRNERTALVGDEVATVDLLALLGSSDDEILAAVGRWYIPKRDVRYVRRNALVALGNSSIVGVDAGQVRRLLSSFTDDDMLNEHARWAANELGLRSSAEAQAAGAVDEHTDHGVGVRGQGAEPESQ